MISGTQISVMWGAPNADVCGLTSDELSYPLRVDTFPVVGRKDEEKPGESRTKRLILENYEVLKEQFGLAIRKRGAVRITDWRQRCSR